MPKSVFNERIAFVMYSGALVAMEIAETVWDLASAAIQEHYRGVASDFLCVSCTL